MSPVITLAAVKGGVGKSTASVNMAGASAKYFGLKTLLFDCTIEGNASLTLKHDEEPGIELARMINDYCFDGTLHDPMNAIVGTSFDNLYLLPSPNSTRIERAVGMLETLGQEDKTNMFVSMFSSLRKFFDVIFVDTMGSASDALTTAALAFSTDILIPLEPALTSIKGYSLTCQGVNKVKETAKHDIRILGAFYSRVHKNRTQDKTLLAQGKDTFKELYIEQPIYDRSIIRDAENTQTPLCYSAPTNDLTEGFRNLTKIVLTRAGIIEKGI